MDNKTVPFQILIQTEEKDKFFPWMEVPPFKELTMGEWRLFEAKHTPRIMRAYFTAHVEYDGVNWVLTKGEGEKKEVWMSLTPMELESQGHHAHAARGSVLIGGFGMGVLAWNVAKKPNVKKIVVLERDRDILKIAETLRALPGWEALNDKMVLVEADALTYQSVFRYDVAIFDIWQSQGDSDVMPDMLKIVKNIPAKEYAAWGIEIDFVDWCIKKGIHAGQVKGNMWREFSKDIGIPLIFRNKPLMTKLAERAGVNFAMEYLERRKKMAINAALGQNLLG